MFVTALRRRNHHSIIQPNAIGCLNAWWDASDSSTLYTDDMTTPVSTDGDLVYAWEDTISAINVKQATSGDRPTYKENIKNGNSVLQFDGSSDNLITPSGLAASDLVGATPTTGGVFLVLYQNSSATGTRIPFCWNVNNTNRLLFTTTSAGTGYEFDWGNADGDGRLSGTLSGFNDAWHIIEGYRNGSNQEYKIDGQFINSRSDATTYPYGSSPLAIGRYSLSALYHWYGYIGEIIVFDDVLTMSERIGVTNYLREKWDI